MMGIFSSDAKIEGEDCYGWSRCEVVADLKSSVGVGSGPRRCETYEECVLFNVGVSLAGPGVAAQDEEKEGEVGD